MKAVIVGGVAGGASVATRLRRMDERAEIVLLERGPYISFANCGLPYYIGGVIDNRDALLVQTPEAMRAIFDVDARVEHDALSIDREDKTLTVRALRTGRTYVQEYDKLVLSPGAEPFVPPIPGRDLPGVFALRSMPHMDAIKAHIEHKAPRRAVVVGGGFIGVELAENLHLRGIQVTLVEMMSQILAPLDFEIATLVHHHLQEHDVRLALSDGVKAIERARDGLSVVLQSGRHAPADMVILAIGVRPENELARQAGLALGIRGTIATNEYLQTSDPDIYAIGDAAEVRHFVTGKPTNIALAGPASKQGRLVADHIAGKPVRYRGAQGTSIVKVFELAVACTGLNERQLQEEGIDYLSVTVHPASHAGYYPGASPMTLKLLFTPQEGKILGAQVLGAEGVDKRVDVLAVAMRAGLTVFDLEEVELAYAPPFGSARDPVNMAGFAAANILRGDSRMLCWHDIDELDREAVFLLDVRYPHEVARGTLDGAVNIPLPQLRSRLDELPRDRLIVVYCLAGQRAYYAYRILVQNGFQATNLSGGYKTYSHATGRQSTFQEEPELYPG
ncbi:MAG: FAD-dependent oxidoreductase [Anaerolineae bacterium]|nr:FAD-dependent oxidoreductase [Anaerolineae bacterium]